MRIVGITFCGIFYSLILPEVLANAEGSTVDSRKALQNFPRNISILPGVRLTLTRDDISLNLQFADLVEGRNAKTKTEAVKSVKKFGFIKKIRPIMMMLPLAMQILRLPGELAEIKVALIRSIVVAKMALVMIIFNAIRNARKPPAVIVHQPDIHEHFYNDFHEPEDEDQGWIG